MALPEAIIEGSDQTLSSETLESFANDLATNEIDQWRRTNPTFASIVLEEDQVLDADVLFFDADGQSRPVTTPSLRERMQGLF
jgi:hypothetical protein